jgi:hypothetical protein
MKGHLMQHQRPCSAQQNQTILPVWQQQITEVAKHPELRRQLARHEYVLLPRFAAHYSELKALPRRLWRNLQRQWKRSLAGVALLFVLGQAPALAATINVNSTCTLGRAMAAANNDTTAGLSDSKGS